MKVKIALVSILCLTGLGGMWGILRADEHPAAIAVAESAVQAFATAVAANDAAVQAFATAVAANDAAVQAFATAVATTPTATLTVEPTIEATPEATPTIEEMELATPAEVPNHMVFAWWDWDYGNSNRNVESALDEITVDIEIHNDIDLAGENGIYLMVCSGDVDGITYYFGLQTNHPNPDARLETDKPTALLFSRWDERDLANARVPDDGWTQSSGHEGDFIGVRRSYAWGNGKYRVRMGQDGDDDEVGRWYGVWITDLSTNEETWIGSLRFPPTMDRPPLIGPRCYNTVEVYGGAPIAPKHIPYWKVTLRPPMGDGAPAIVTEDGHSWPASDEFRNSRFEYAEDGSIVYEVGLDHIPKDRLE